MNVDLRQALDHHRCGEIEKARALYQQILEHHPQDLECLILLGILTIQENNPSAALDYFLTAEKQDPNHAQVQVYLGNTYKALEHFELALNHYQKALNLKPDYPQALHNLANLYAAMNDPLQAIVYYEKAIEQLPDYLEAYEHLALTYFKMGDKTHAKEYFNLVYERDPKRSICNYYLGNFALEADDWSKALKHYELSVQTDPQHLPSLVNLAAVYAYFKERAKAISTYQTILSFDPDDLIVHMNLAALYILDKDWDLALEQYAQVLDLDKNNFDAYFNLGVIFMEKERYDLAASYLQTAVSLQPQNADAHYNYATSLLKQDLKQSAEYHLKQAITFDPNNEVFQFRWAAISGQALPLRPPKAYIETLFDRYAERFDQDLLEKLEYRAPELLAELLKELLSQIAAPRVMDLGCGTGLCGQRLRADVNVLIGVDLSSQMLAIARDKKIYDELIQADMLDVFSDRDFKLDALVSGDVFIYWGDLQPLFLALKTALNSGAYLAFSCEECKGESFTLSATGRYQHSFHYIQTLLEQTGFTLLTESAVSLRQQQGEAVAGRVYLCQK